ncbi:hypothetical protein [Winogradskyella sp.]|uniref:hypothetical protein n=1 Tax=Winogradskyella sp. TaxID=1883156 RepID=UPI002637B8A7|nr:hypothetical protein [Winogradskyella sp.]
MVISRFKLFNFYFYKRKRLSEDIIEISFDNYFCDDVGLYAIYRDHNFEFNFVSLTEKKDWEQLVLWTFRLTLFNLLTTKSLQLAKFEDEKIYINGLFKKKHKGFFFHVLNNQTKGTDKFSSLVLKLVSKANVDYGRSVSLHHYIRFINDWYLKTGAEYNRPEKRFIIELIKDYAKDYKWINIVSHKKILGIYKQHEVVINRIHIPRLNIHHKQLEDYYNECVLEHYVLRQFTSTLKEALQIDFNNRYPKGDGD